MTALSYYRISKNFYFNHSTIFFLLLIIICFGCENRNTNSSLDKIGTLNLIDAKIENIPLVNSEVDFIEKYGPPVSTVDSCSNTGLSYKQGFIYYDCLKFDKFPNIEFKKINDTIFVHSINFVNNDLVLTLSSIEISSKTTIRELENSIPNISANLNKGANMIPLEKGLNWLYLSEQQKWDYRPNGLQIELRFNGENLIEFIYNWTPAYTEQQWNNYLKVKSELEARYRR